LSHCENLERDRGVGAFWEARFCEMARLYGHYFTPHQFERERAASVYGPNRARLILPDITIWSGEGEHHEVKHKAPTAHDSFGLEAYRFDSLVAFAGITGEPVYYTIHNHALAGGFEATENHIDHWVQCEVTALAEMPRLTARGRSWVNNKVAEVEIHYWPMNFFSPLAYVWPLRKSAEREGGGQSQRSA
jgi:hypothetical protein